ncbi:MAG: hypothetical protein HYZ71_08150 [Deltaproteobacteria bacterium]|nr:hypothetical protein [Deltaproteobacteria bacterium]
MKRAVLKLSVLLSVTILVSGCGLVSDLLFGPRASKHKSGTGEAPAAQVDFQFENSIQGYYKEAIQKDLGILSDAGLSGMDGSDILDISSFDNNSLRDWLSARVKYIIPQSFPRSYSTEKSGVSYPSDLFGALFDPAGSATMSNFGVGVYNSGKKARAVYSIWFNAAKVIVTSPRMGIVKIEDSLLTGRIVPGSSYLDDVNSYFRISTYFHEGRHSDGHGADTGLLHEVCPSGDYAGKSACDRYTNGPYSVARVLLSHFRDICKDCNKKEKSAIDLFIADNAARVTDNARQADPAPESVIYP